ncbi:prolipoprotein diacylglyceryl transferase [Desulfovibrio ferrophilus]|uniref:Phosphatidylglycerol--prolipoprotein diacylglyceryl transferase n=1 Tax=Desulfovibrio ferrophilus TaxID=241368 RepID=A0A2Z6B0M4_9BACT|nr:prolipoprotein diacylglyceryl transferase [Desulfovibrio ferrophilus]BBD09051.1 prolipoprotein diacylglyceryl transferase [Desulfovibrio ferrophilus]
MLTYPRFDPTALSIGPVNIHWYGLMYLVGFAGGWLLGRWRASRPGSDWTATEVDDLIAMAMFGVVLGGRLGYVLFYEPMAYLADPLSIVKIWNGGMSFHGGLLGVIFCFWLHARRTGRTFWAVSDFVAPLVPIGLGAGRIGNFINGELWGRVTDVPWAMIFPGWEAGPYPRHPSQLYEFALEGVVLFCLLFIFSSRRPPERAVSGLFALGYGFFRFLVEFVRQPDAHLGHVALGMTMGQLLSLPLMLYGMYLLWTAYRRHA